MPRISEFYGIVIKLFYSDHQRPHLHAYYAEYRARFLIATGEVMDHGPFPVRGARLVRRWVALHRDELNANWERVRSSQPPVKIEPLP